MDKLTGVIACMLNGPDHPSECATVVCFLVASFGVETLQALFLVLRSFECCF